MSANMKDIKITEVFFNIIFLHEICLMGVQSNSLTLGRGIPAMRWEPYFKSQYPPRVIAEAYHSQSGGQANHMLHNVVPNSF